MSNKTFDVLVDEGADGLAKSISDKWTTWLNARASWEERYRTSLQFLYSVTTDTIYGPNSNPWQSNVHIAKLTQLRDVLITYYLESLFSMSSYYEFEGFTKDSNVTENRVLVKNLLRTILEEGDFKRHIEKAVADYVDAGNCFGMPVWEVDTVTEPSGVKKIVWEGVRAERINPLDIVFDPLAKDFKHTPKIIRTVLSLGEVAALAEKDPLMKKAFTRALKRRDQIKAAKTNGDSILNDELNIAGFGSMTAYASSDTVELLTFYGSLYDVTSNKLHNNTKITIMDRGYVLSEEPLEPVNNYDTIFHVGWRDRKDILWGMSPIENVLPLQARIDFLENKRTDCYDFVTNPVKKIKGNVELPDALAPGDEIHMDLDADVTYLTPDTTILTADNLIAMYEDKMEAFMGSPREVLGFRTPGEKTGYEVRELLTAATRIFQRQIVKFEQEYFEPLMNSMLSLYLYKMAGQKINLRFWDEKNEYYAFKDITVDQIHALGKIKAMGSTAYREKAQISQALQMLGQNPLFMDDAVINNISPSSLGKIFMFVSGLDKFSETYKKDSRLYEVTDQKKLVESLSQQVDEVKAAGLKKLDQQANAYEEQKAIANDRLMAEGGNNAAQQ